jgi:hypothetical protein
MPQDVGRMNDMTPQAETVEFTRRRALARLGLAVGAAYAAPLVLHLDREAKAQVMPTPCPPPNGNCGDNPTRCVC